MKQKQPGEISLIFDPSLDQESAKLAPTRHYGSDDTKYPLSRPIIAMHPGSGGYSTARRWSPEHFALLADTLFRDTGGQLILLGGPEETTTPTNF